MEGNQRMREINLKWPFCVKAVSHSSVQSRNDGSVQKTVPVVFLSLSQLFMAQCLSYGRGGKVGRLNGF